MLGIEPIKDKGSLELGLPSMNGLKALLCQN